MTIKDKIKNLNFYDLIAKLKGIFLELDSKIEEIEDKVNTPISPTVPQNLQNVLDTGNYAEKDNGNSYVDILGNTFGNYYFDFNTSNGIFGSGQLSSSLYSDRNRVFMIGVTSNEVGRIQVTNGLVEIHREAAETNKKTVISIDRPTQNTFLHFPAKSVAGTYTIATLDDIKIGTVAPTSATASGTTGEIRVAAGFIYWCTAPNTWIRAAGVTW